MQTWYFDVTKTLEFGLQTGIQRVVRQVTQSALAQAPARGVEVVPVVAVDGRFHRLTPDGLAALASNKPSPRAQQHIAAPALHRRVLRDLLALSPALQARWLERQTDRRFRREHAHLFTPEPVDPAHGDVLVLIDLLFGGSPAVRAAERWMSRGIRSIVVVYDMIPVTHPALMTALVRDSFRRSLLRVTRGTAGVMTISAFCAAEVARFLTRYGRPQPVGFFHLGHAMSGANKADHDGLVDAAAIWRGDGRVFVMVGSIEPRKGHALVLDAFERAWAAGSTAKLVVIGNPGWNMAPFMARLREHPQRDRRVFVVHDASDALIVDSLRRSDAAIVASEVEGFGLPLVEALSLGTPVLAADIPVFREIAEGWAIWFDREDLQAVADLIGRFEHDAPAQRDRVAAFTWIDWAEATRRFLDGVQAILADANRQASAS